MTEDEAKTKWCPFARVVLADPDKESRAIVPHHAAYNMTKLIGEDDRSYVPCIASTCMAWRWRTVANPAARHNIYSNPNPEGITSTADGYCGLAGGV